MAGRLRKNKKGNLTDNFFAMTIFFVFLLVMTLSYTFWNMYNNEVQAIDEDVIDNRTKQELEDMGNIFITIDSFVPYIFIMLWVLVIIFSLTVRPDHPAFFILSVIALFIFTLVFVIFTELGLQWINNELISLYVGDLVSTTFFLKKYHFISFFVMLISLIFFYSRVKSESGVVLPE